MRAKGKKPAATTTSSGRQTITDRVDALAEVLRRHELTEIEVEEGGVRIYVRRGGGEAMHVPAPTAVPVHSPLPSTAHAPAAGASSGAPSGGASQSSTDTGDGNVAYVTSPFVGTFYRAPSPDMSPFVDVGTRIKKGQVLCIVEAMKLMNEIESEIEGSIVQILVENGQAVEYGEPLFKIKVG
ncbi:MAG TPA: acetyl-CoA carboxylase biotin carboxyl carrier protein [Polyangia bacterium]|jgi:acetyl-CoA carboxylase biotin carboxyl carrier protein|nr:acetyl-CoA carboxylase biotin carboxyl carrier protein [Polyangia bacterium]